MEINKDKPIQSHEVDLLHREKFVNSIVNLLHNNDDDDSLTISLYGEWGSGKTSIINMICERLTSVDKEGSGYGEGEEYIKIIHFNPWLYSNASDLTRQFFTHLQGELGKSKAHKFATVVTQLGQYKEAMVPAISLLFGPTAGIATKVGIDALTTYTSQTENRSLQTIKDEIVEKLKELKQKIVIFIDDIDRLSDEEIVTTFKLVKLLADFPYVTYVLAFDYEVVAEALNRVQHNRGKEYMEKIIQVPIAIPAIQKKDIENLYLEYLHKVLGESKVQRMLSLERGKQLYAEGIMPYLTTMRSVKRFFYNIRSKLAILKNDMDSIDSIDLMGVCCLEVFEHELHQKLLEYRDFLCKPYMELWILDNEKQKKVIQEKLKQLLSMARKTEAARSILLCLFPSLNSYVNDKALYEVYPYEEQLMNYSICHINNFDRYFVWNLDSNKITKIGINEFLIMYDKQTVRNTLMTYYTLGKLGDFIDYVVVYIDKKERQEILRERIKLIIDSLFWVLGRIDVKVEALNKISVVAGIYRLLNTFKEEKHDALIEEIFNSTELHISSMARFLYSAINNLEKVVQAKLLSSSGVDRLKQVFMKKAVDTIKNRNFIDDTYGLGFLNLMDMIDKDCLRNIKEYIIADIRGLIKLVLYVSEGSVVIQNLQDFTRVYTKDDIDENMLYKFITKEDVVRRVGEYLLKPGFERLEELEKKRLAIFLYIFHKKERLSFELFGENKSIILNKVQKILKIKEKL